MLVGRRVRASPDVAPGVAVAELGRRGHGSPGGVADRGPSDSPYYPGGQSEQGVTFRIVCEAECVGTLETEGGIIRTVHWDGDELRVELPDEESGDARCFDADQQPVPGSATMTVRRTHDFVLAASEPDEDGRPTRLEGRTTRTSPSTSSHRDCGFPTPSPAAGRGAGLGRLLARCGRGLTRRGEPAH